MLSGNKRQLQPLCYAARPRVSSNSTQGRLTWFRHTEKVLLAVELVKEGVQTSCDVPSSLQITNMPHQAGLQATQQAADIVIIHQQTARAVLLF